MISTEKEITKKYPKILTTPKIIKNSFFKFAKAITHEKTINEFLKSHEHLVGFEFIDAVLEYFDFDYVSSSKEIENIPKTGKVVIIANHPLGALDALTLLKLVSTVRKDIKIVANDFLGDIKNISSQVIAINNFKTSTKEMVKPIYEALNNEMAVIIFPAGEVSRVTPAGIKDKKWHKGFLKFAQKTASPILPVFLGGKNSKTFYTLSILNKSLSTILLSNEMFKQKSRKIEIKIGGLILFENIYPKNIDKDEIASLYKKHVYLIGKNSKRKLFETECAIAHPEDSKTIKEELRESEILGQTNDGKKIYLYKYSDDSIILREIGRLREVSFRKVGEGVNKKRDTDKYDKYYKHILLWDEEKLEIVGAYRIASANEVMPKYGNDGFYSNTLFQFNDTFTPYLKDSIELGRSFVQPKYWGTRALDYLWYGIGAYLSKNPNIKYMFGPVSLSSNYPTTAQNILVYFYDFYFGMKEEVVTPKLKYTMHKNPVFLAEISNLFELNDYTKDFKILKQTMNSIGYTVPTLYKQYTELCENGGAKFLGFNIDPDFNNCIDGFILVDVGTIKDSHKQRYIPNFEK
jgi:putative hemolysin